MFDEGFVEMGSDGCYCLGLWFLYLVLLVWVGNDIWVIVWLYLECLCEKVGEIVYFGVLIGIEIVYFDKVEVL